MSLPLRIVAIIASASRSCSRCAASFLLFGSVDLGEEAARRADSGSRTNPGWAAGASAPPSAGNTVRTADDPAKSFSLIR
jgi:hypothetical protein